MCLFIPSSRKRSGRAQRTRAEVAPKLSPSALVRASDSLWSGCFPDVLASPRSYSRTELLDLAPPTSLLPPSLLRHTPTSSPASSPVALNPSPVTPFVTGLLVNARSLPGHAAQIFQILDSHAPDLLAVTETWLTPSSGPDLVAALPDSYSILQVDRVSSSPGGGLALIFKSTIKCLVLPLAHSCKMEACLIRCTISATFTIHLLLIYRPPPADSFFAASLLELVSPLALAHSNLVIMGDFNVWPDTGTDLHALALTSFLGDLGLLQLVTGSTHEYGHTLDLIFANPDLSIQVGPPLPTDWSDHFLIPWVIPFSPSPPPPPVFSAPCRKWSTSKINEFPLEFQSALFNCQEGNNFTLQAFDLALRHAADSLAPLTPSRIRAKPSAPWFTPELKFLRLACKRAERRWRREYLAPAKVSYVDARRQYSDAILEAKKFFFASRISSSLNSSRELFSTIKTLSSPPSAAPVSSSQSLCDSLAFFFIEKIAKIRSGIAATIVSPSTLSSQAVSSPTGLLDPATPLLDSLTAGTSEEVSKALLALKSASPLDPVPLRVLKQHLPSFLPALTKAVNVSFHSGHIPPSLKHALVIPLLKKPSLDPSLPSNFRPISLLPVLMKLLEALVTPQLRSFLESFNLLHSFQSGFRPMMGTETVLTAVLDDLSLIRDQGGVGALILLDLSAAFDTIDHSTLLARLGEVGVSGSALAWFQSFLSDRSQTLSMPPFTSASFPITCGVPQGSSLSPLLFNVYMRPLAELIQSHGFKFYSYADDTQILLRLDVTNSGMAERFRSCMEAVGSWMNTNWLKLNGDKTELLVVAPVSLSPSPSLFTADFWPSSMGPVPMPAPVVKNLGVKILPSLSMEAQISAVCSAGHLKLKIIKKILKFIPPSLWAPVIGSAIHGSIDYCNALFLGQTAKQINRLQILQNTAVRLVLGLPKRCHVSAARRSLHWLPVHSRITFKVLCMTHRAFYDSGPRYLRDKIQRYVPHRLLRSSNSLQLCEPRYCRERSGGRAFSVLAPRLWNQLPLNIRSTSNHLGFRRLLKTSLFNI